MRYYPHMNEEKLNCKMCGGAFTRNELQIQSSWTTVEGERRQSYCCRACNTERVKTYRRSGGMNAARRAVINYEKKNLIKRRAWRAACTIPLGPCEVCGTRENIHRHHDDYSKPREVKMLCGVHHKARHRELKAQGITL